jgi:DNA-binding CsgD family transcriptional regulator
MNATGFDRCSAVLMQEISRSKTAPLRREHECLQMSAGGKTAWETGMMLSIAEATVVKILAFAIRKLDCANKPQAVVKALRLGLVH